MRQREAHVGDPDRLGPGHRRRRQRQHRCPDQPARAQRLARPHHRERGEVQERQERVARAEQVQRAVVDQRPVHPESHALQQQQRADHDDRPGH